MYSSGMWIVKKGHEDDFARVDGLDQAGDLVAVGVREIGGERREGEPGREADPGPHAGPGAGGGHPGAGSDAGATRRA